jgi:2-C-methyl-D-erythritol 2,4-cyclodiphosphate synthase
MTSAFRIGHGYDLHRLQAGGRLVLGGVVVAEGISPVAHSDGDVIIHAIVDAVLGALGQGDIGEIFPDSDPAFRNASSEMFLKDARKRLAAEEFVVSNCDVLILAERPKLKSFKTQMKAYLEGILGGVVNIKAGTNEGCGEIGRGEAIAAHAVVLLERRA